MAFLLNVARFLIAVLLGWTVVTGVLVVGWVARLSRRAAVNQLLHRKGKIRLSEVGHTASLATIKFWPGWIMGPVGAAGWRRWVGGLAENIRLGLACFVPTFLVTAPAGALWLFSWWGGWNNSFNKGYEQSWVGPTVALVGFVLWLAVVTLIPLAQARVALTGDWRAFFGFRLLRTIAARCRWGLFGVAVVGVGAALWLLFIRALPALILQNQIADIHLLPPEDIRRIAAILYLSTGALMLVAFLIMHVWAARLYAAGLLRALDGKFIEAEKLHPAEKEWLAILNGAPDADSAPSPAIRSPRILRGANAAIAAPLTLIAWFGVVALLYVAQFLLYAPANWLLHPVLHMPWVRVWGA